MKTLCTGVLCVFAGAALTFAAVGPMAVPPPAAPAAPSAPATQPAAGVKAIDAGVEKLAAQLAGAFATTKQAAVEPTYWDIRLHMTRIWPDRTDGIWLYVEQARADLIDQPYRQRVYRVLRRADGKLVSEVYTLPGTMDEQVEKYAGAWKDAKKLEGVTPEALSIKAGCEMIMAEKDAGFTGGTDGKKCPSSLKGATYATSEAVVTPEGLRTWDRGYDAADKQVWGAVKGPYLFERQEP